MRMLVVRALILLAATVACQCTCTSTCSNGTSTCPALIPLNIDLSQLVANQPLYVVFNPLLNTSSIVDNVCVTYFPVPGNNNTDNYVSYITTVFTNNTGRVSAFIVTQPQPGEYNYGKDSCAYTDTVFASVVCDVGYTVYLARRCPTFGNCPNLKALASPSRVYGFTTVQRPISSTCLSIAEAVILANGLPQDNYHTLPMTRNNQCVLNQTCAITPASNCGCLQQST